MDYFGPSIQQKQAYSYRYGCVHCVVRILNRYIIIIMLLLLTPIKEYRLNFSVLYK